jgi:hypothetical protein
MLVLLIKGIYEVFCLVGFIWHDIHTRFHENLHRHPSNIKVLPKKISGNVILVILMEGIYELCH